MHLALVVYCIFLYKICIVKFLQSVLSLIQHYKINL